MQKLHDFKSGLGTAFAAREQDTIGLGVVVFMRQKFAALSGLIDHKTVELNAIAELVRLAANNDGYVEPMRHHSTHGRARLCVRRTIR